jgi:hypothetical protein
MLETVDVSALKIIMKDAQKLAKKYRELTGKPLGITGEVGEFSAAELLKLQLTTARQPGYDAIAADGHRIQIKARCVLPDSKKSQRMGSIRLNHDWDTVMLILMDSDFGPLKIYEAKRSDIEIALAKPGSKARNERGALAISKFIAISDLVWSNS